MNTEHQPMYDWKDLPWRTIERNVFKLQKRIYQASQRGDQSMVRKLQRLLMTSWSAKCLAVRRVTQDNQGKKTAGVDGVKALSPRQRLALVNILRVDLPVKPVRRGWIPKPNNPAEQRPLGIPIWAAHYPSFQAMFGIPCVLLRVDRELRSILIVLLYHTFTSITSASVLPLPPDWLAQCCDDLRSKCNPAWSQRRGTNTLQDASLAPVRDGRDIDIEQVCCGSSRVAPIPPLPSWCGFRTLWTSCRDVIGVANPLDLADRKRASHPCSLSFLIEEGCNVCIGVQRRQLPHALDHLCAGLAFFPRHFVAWDGQPREGLCLPPNSHIDDVASLGERHILDQPAQQLLALSKGGGGSMPDGWQVVRKMADLLALRGREREGRLFGSQSIFPFQFFACGQFLIPFAFQTAGHQTIVWVDSLVPSPCQVRLILGPLDLTVPLLIDLLGAGFQRIERGESHLQVGRLDRLQKALNYSLINPISSQCLAGFGGKLPVGLVTFVHQQRAIPLIADAHPSATGATQNNPLQERWPLSNGPTMVFRAPGAVIIELSLVAQELVPGNVARMLIQQHNRPLLLFHPARSP